MLASSDVGQLRGWPYQILASFVRLLRCPPFQMSTASDIQPSDIGWDILKSSEHPSGNLIVETPLDFMSCLRLPLDGAEREHYIFKFVSFSLQ